MWNLKTLRLLNGQTPQGNLLSAEEIARHQQAEDILALAHLQAQEIIDAAREQAAAESARYRLQQESEFWQQADVLLSGWHQQRQQDEQQLVQLADQLLNDALRQVLNETSDERRFHALLRQLLRHHPRSQQATLYCHAERERDISAWLAQQPQLVWTLRCDDALAGDELRLITPEGELAVSWRTLCEQFAVPCATPA